MGNHRPDRHQFRARTAGLLFLIAIGVGVFAEFRTHGEVRSIARFIALLCYVAVAWLFYQLFKPVDQRLSLTAALLSLVLLVVGPLRWHPAGVDVGLACFGLSCLTIAYLVFRSGFLPKALALASGLAGIAWLTFLWQPFARSIYPYNLAAGVLGQAALCMWLMVFGTHPSSAGRRA
jgi:hypothetical protein